jgi:branched-chain amino acid transport system substrate-binding protein
MATVFLANDPSFERQVAVKVLPREFLHDPQFRKRFEREAKAIATLEHPAIVPVYDFGEEDGQPFLVMRYMPGDSLATEIAKVERFSPDRTALILRQLAPALDAAHARGFIHRDIKPDNILFDHDGNAYLSDFGLVRMAESASTLTGKMLLGTPAYMSPEQARGKTKLEGKSDLYSLGVVLFEMLSGERPFEADTPMGLAMMHVNDPIPNIREINPDLPIPLDAVLEKALAKSPEDRYETAVALSLAFEQGSKELPGVGVVDQEEAEATTHLPIDESEKTTLDVGETVLSPAVDETLRADVDEDSETRVLEGKMPPTLDLGLPIDSPSVTKKRTFPIWAMGVIGLVILGAAAGGFAYFTGMFESEEPPPPTPTTRPTESVAVAEPEEEPAPPTPTSHPTPTEVVATEPFQCQDEIGCVSYGPDAPIRLASALVISGPNAQLGLDSLYSVEIAIEFRREISGHPIELQSEDDGCSKEGGEQAAETIVSDPTILGVVGTSCSSAAVSMLPIISDAGYFMISPSNTSPLVTDPELYWQPGYLRTSHNDRVQGAVAAQFARNELNLVSAAAIHDSGPYTQSLAELFISAFEELGGTIVDILAIQSGDQDLRTELSSLATAGPPDFLYYPVFMPECEIITSQARMTAGLENTLLASADGCFSRAAAEALGEEGEGVLFSGPDFFYSGQLYNDFLDAYRNKAGSDPISIFHAHAFDATNMILDCIEQVGVLETDGTLNIGRQDMRSCLYATENFQGISSTITCDPFGDCANPKIVFYELRRGEYKYIWP